MSGSIPGASSSGSRGTVLRSKPSTSRSACIRTWRSPPCRWHCFVPRSSTLTEDEDDLRSLTDEAIHHGTAGLKPELRKVLALASGSANADEKPYLALIEKRIEEGSLAELMRQRTAEGIRPVLEDMAESLRTNVPYRG